MFIYNLFTLRIHTVFQNKGGKKGCVSRCMCVYVHVCDRQTNRERVLERWAV